MDFCSPSVHKTEADQIESALLEILNMCQIIAAQLLEPGMDKELVKR